MSKYNIKKDKSNLLIFISLSLISLVIIGVIKCDSSAIKKHLIECVEVCKPDEVIEILSSEKCMCRKILNKEESYIKK